MRLSELDPLGLDGQAVLIERMELLASGSSLWRMVGDQSNECY